MSKRDRNRIEQRARILDSARLLFATHGFDEVTVAEIAESAGVARATVFNHFASKHALVDAITEDVFAYFVGMLDRALADTLSSTPALVRGLFAHMGEGIEQVARFYRAVFREIAKLQVGLEEGSAGARARLESLDRLEEIFERGLARGDIRAGHGARELATACDSLANGTIVHWLYEDTSSSLRARMCRASELLLGPVAAGDAWHDEPMPDLIDPRARELQRLPEYAALAILARQED